MSGKELLRQVLENPKAAVTVSAATTGTGIGTIIDLIPDEIGKVATVVGIVLSSVLIYTHVLTHRKIKLEMAIMQGKESERVAAAHSRREAGEPLRRECDG